MDNDSRISSSIRKLFGVCTQIACGIDGKDQQKALGQHVAYLSLFPLTNKYVQSALQDIERAREKRKDAPK